MVRGHRPTRVCEDVQARFGVCEAQAWEDIAAVRDRWAREDADERPRRREALLASVDRLVDEAYAARDLKTVRGALALRAQVCGLVVTRQTEQAAGLTPEERAALAAGLDGSVGPRDGR